MRAAIVALLVLVSAVARAETTNHESTALRVEVTADPYSYRVIARATGQVLLAQSQTTFAIAVPPPDGGAPADDGGMTVSDAGPPDGAAPSDAPVEDAAVAPPAPTIFSAKVLRATSFTPRGDTLLVHVELESPGGTGVVRFAFLTAGTLEVTLSRDAGPARQVGEQFHDQQEHVYGLWEYPFGGSLDNRGQEHDYLGVTRNQGSNYTSGRAPFYFTSLGYGVYVRSDHFGHFSVAQDGQTAFLFEEPALSYDIVYGPSYQAILDGYRQLTGGFLMPPLWALGATWWSDDFNQDLHGPDAQSNVLDLATQLQKQHIPASGLLIDRPYGSGVMGWGNMDFSPAFPDPAAMTAALHDHGLQLMLWIANRSWNSTYDLAQAMGFLFPGGGSNNGPAVDLSSNAAIDWMTSRLEPLATLATAYKIDRGEEGEIPPSSQNVNVTTYQELALQGLVSHHPDDAFIISRNAADTGRQHTAVWSGDAQATFDGLTTSVAAGIRSGLILMPMWGSDAGGYNRSATTPTEEGFARWLAFAAWSPLMEVLVGQGHTPWYEYSAALVEIARQHSVTHFDLIPYTRSFLNAAALTGAPVMRPMFLDYPDEPALADQYLYGSELLVAPVLTTGATTRDVRVPPGQWLDYNGRHRAWGPGMANLPAPLDTIPVLVREGGIVTRGALLRANDDWTTSWAPSLRVEVFPADHDLDRQVDYFTGQDLRPIEAKTAGHAVTVHFDDLGTPGTVEVQTKTASKVTVNGAVQDLKVDGRVLRVPFTGPTTLVVEGITSLFVPDPTPDAAAGAPVAATPPSHGGGCSYGGRPGGLALLLAVLFSYRAARRRRAAGP